MECTTSTLIRPSLLLIRMREAGVFVALQSISAAQVEDPPPPPRRQPPPVPKKAIKSDQSKCGICYQWVEIKPKAKANIHFNKCWDGLREKVKEAKDQIAKNSLEESKIGESGEVLSDIPQVASSALDEKEEPSTSIPPFSSDLEETACLLCHKDLYGMKDLDAFNHRLICLKTLSLARWPVCELSFTGESGPCDDELPCKGTGWEIYTILWHLHACQNNCHTCPEAQKDWTAFTSRWTGRTEVTQRVFWKNIGERKDWDLRKHRDSVKTKKKSGLAREDGIYRMKSSPLRNLQRIVPTRLPPKLVSKPLNVTSPIKKLPTDGAAAVNCPITSDKDELSSQLRLLRTSLEALAPMISAAKSDALLKAPQRCSIPRNKDELDDFQKKLLDLLKPVAEQQSVTLPRKARSFPELTLTCPQEEPDSPPASASSLSSNQSQAGSVALSQAPSGNATPSPATAIQMPPSSTSSPPNDSPSTATTPRHGSLDAERPDLHIIGESENWRNSPAGAQERFRRLVKLNSAKPYLGRSRDLGMQRLAEAEAIPNYIRSSPNPWPASFGERRSMTAVTLPVRGRPAYPLPSRLLRWTFYNFQELDREMEVETYTYGRRGAIPVALESNIRIVIDPTLFAQDQTARNRECCRGMFGNFTETSE
ncbi:hypothetical protein BKA58DRAFT_447268 [Alternaria rosae]|uniref:uncharacterized protein n=1 Tax=Alternaria rosae TaxID=1187941 RepID=UPI001E8DBB83|nr:uncharacterized protein BKA58DRAFT_447268 [Alternaria rosae]KAH6882650.1 hypothetical protein BKA58DRAFT_447268 [Alternaria rosae]